MEGRRVESGEVIIRKGEIFAWFGLGLAISVGIGVLVGLLIADTLRGVAITF